MTIFCPEGLSKSGKSTVMDMLRENCPDWVFVKNFNMVQSGILDDWLDEWYQYHKFGYLFANQNPDTVWFHDRFMTEAVYNPDPKVRQEVMRFGQGFKDMHILFFHPGKEELMDRGTGDAWRYEEVRERYDKLLESYPHTIIDTGDNTVEQSALDVVDYVHEVHDRNAETPNFPG